MSSEVELTHIPASEGQGKEREAERERRERGARRGRKRQKKGIGEIIGRQRRILEEEKKEDMGKKRELCYK